MEGEPTGKPLISSRARYPCSARVAREGRSRSRDAEIGVTRRNVQSMRDCACKMWEGEAEARAQFCSTALETALFSKHSPATRADDLTLVQS